MAIYKIIDDDGMGGGNQKEDFKKHSLQVGHIIIAKPITMNAVILKGNGDGLFIYSWNVEKIQSVQ